MLRMKLPGQRKRGRPDGWFTEAVRHDMAAVEVMEEDAEDITEWRWKIGCGTSRENFAKKHAASIYPHT